MNNFTFSDLLGALLALCAWALLFLPQGLTLGWSTDLLQFRRRCALRQLGIAAVLSLCMLPAVFALVAGVGGVNAVVALVILGWIVFACLGIANLASIGKAVRHLAWQFNTSRYFVAAAAVWIVLALGVVLDLQVDNKLFLSMTTYDHSNLVAFTDAILRHGLPPVNPTYFPGAPQPVFYHYYWVLVCAVISRIFGFTLHTRPVVIGGILWTGLVFMMTLVAAARYFSTSRAAARLAPRFTVAALIVSNLYVLVAVPLWFYTNRMFACIDWWTRDQMGSFLESMYWIPHHILGLSAGILGSILLLKAFNQPSLRCHLLMAGAGGACLATELGTSAYTAVGFGLAWGIWALAALLGNRRSQFLVLLTALVVVIALSIPFVLQGTAIGGGAVNSYHLSMRRFEAIWAILPPMRLTEVQQNLIYFLLLPINYFSGWGLICVGGALFWWHRRKQEIPIKHRFLLVLVAVGVVLGTFVRSSDFSNDFGWRVIMVANVALLIWTGQYLAQCYIPAGKVQLPVLVWLVIAGGLCTTLVGYTLDRTSMWRLYNVNRVFAVRSAYEQLNSLLTPDAVIQHDPRREAELVVDIFALLYSHRQTAVEVNMHGLLSGARLSTFDKTASDLQSLFTNIDDKQAVSICDRNGVDVVFVKDTDWAFDAPDSWLRKHRLLVRNDRVQAFLIHPQAARLPAGTP